MVAFEFLALFPCCLCMQPYQTRKKATASQDPPSESQPGAEAPIRVPAGDLREPTVPAAARLREP